MSIAENLKHLREEIAAVCERVGRNPSEIVLVGVSKRVPPGRIREAIDAGLPALGENYVQEALPKIAEIGHPVPWHFIGHLQRNKAKLAAQHFDLIQTVDSLALAQALHRHAEALQRRLPVLLEVKLVDDPDRPGILPGDLPRLEDGISALSHLQLQGLMGMPPPVSSKEDARPDFRTLKRLWDALHNENRQVLSMGMTADYPIAIEEGATLIRVGTGIFGSRSRPGEADGGRLRP